MRTGSQGNSIFAARLAASEVDALEERFLDNPEALYVPRPVTDDVWFVGDDGQSVHGTFLRHQGEMLTVRLDNGQRRDVSYEWIYAMPTAKVAPYDEEAIITDRGCTWMYHQEENTHSILKGSEVLLDHVPLVQIQDWCWPDKN